MRENTKGKKIFVSRILLQSDDTDILISYFSLFLQKDSFEDQVSFKLLVKIEKYP